MATVKPSPQYGGAGQYLDKQGEEYFAWQNSASLFRGKINSHKFQHLVQPEFTVLDFGCGGGGLLQSLACARKIGVEINPAALKELEASGIESYADAADVPDGIADLIVSDHALEHVPYPIAALAALRPKLKPTGILSVCVPIDNWRSQRHYQVDDQNHHLYTWTPQSFGNCLYEAGYEVVEVRARISQWPGRWTVATYGRLPFWMFRTICYVYGSLTGNGAEILAVAKPRK